MLFVLPLMHETVCDCKRKSGKGRDGTYGRSNLQIHMPGKEIELGNKN